MTDENQSVSAADYKAARLKQNFATKVAQYEDDIATLQTQLAMAQQRAKQLEEQLWAQEPDEAIDAEVLDTDDDE